MADSPSAKYESPGVAARDDRVVGWPDVYLVVRDEDEKRRSGVGVIAYVVEFADGTAVWRWTTEPRTTKVADSLDDLEELHGHGGATELVAKADFEADPVDDNQEVPR